MLYLPKAPPSATCFSAFPGGVSFGSVRLVPIFDTSAVINLAKRDPADVFWSCLKRCLPARGSPLSFITVLELIRGLRLSGADQLDDSLRAVILASQLSRRKVLLTPVFFLQRELFGIRAAAHEQSSATLKRWLGITLKPSFKREFISGSVEGMNLEKIEPLFVMIEQKHSGVLEQFLTKLYPGWRSEREKFGSSMPEAVREEIKRKAPVDEWRRNSAEYFLESMKIERTPERINAIRIGCDAYFTFSVNLMRDSIVSNYRFEDNPNDFHDGLQLLYLSRPQFCLVTEDKRSIGRASKSSQSNRILTIDQFISVNSPH